MRHETLQGNIWRRCERSTFSEAPYNNNDSSDRSLVSFSQRHTHHVTTLSSWFRTNPGACEHLCVDELAVFASWSFGLWKEQSGSLAGRNKRQSIAGNSS